MVSKYSDAPVKSCQDDKLGFEEYAEGVISIIEDISKEDTPFTLGLFGSWGSGKTSFMRIMKYLLEESGYKTIFFNSWEFANEEKPWIPFMIKVVNELFKEEEHKIDKKIDKKPWISFKINVVNKLFKKKAHKIGNKINKPELIQNIFLFSTDLVLQHYSHGKLSTGHFLDLLKKSRKKSPIKGWSEKDTNTVIERVTKIDEFKMAIEERAVDTPKGKIVIFIDDLDRIPEKLIDFLNNLKVFFDIKGCIFILGCDHEILKCVLKEKYKEEIFEDYFDKIVQAEFYIPKISERAIKDYLKVLTEWSDDEIKDCTKLVLKSIGGNPRKIKRVVNETKLLISVFEAKLVTVLKEFEKPKQFERPELMTDILPMEDSGKRVIEKPKALESNITDVFTSSRVFEILFDRILLFKLVCIRKEWPDYYQNLQKEDTYTDVPESPSSFLALSPKFQGTSDIKT